MAGQFQSIKILSNAAVAASYMIFCYFDSIHLLGKAWGM